MFDFRKWFRKTFRVDGRFTRNRPKHCPRQARLALETLEDRLVPSATDLIGTTTYLSQYPAAAGYPTSNGDLSPPQMLGVQSQNLATGSFTGTWADGLNHHLIPVTGQINQLITGSNGVNLDSITLNGSTSGEIMAFSGYVESSAAGMEMLGQFTDFHTNWVADQLVVAGFNQNAPAPGGLTLGQQAMEWAVSQYGLPVSETFNGISYTNCTNLVDKALLTVGANGIDYYNTQSVLSGGYGNYQWGTSKGTFHPNTESPSDYNSIQPGDVLQFHDVGPRLQTAVNSDGYSYNYANQQHTAIVVDNRGNGVLDVIDQNVDGQNYVSMETINLAQMTGGASDAEISVYQPV